MPFLPEQDEEPVCGAEGDDVEDHGLEREHDRAERPGEQHEHEQRKDGEHDREVAVDGAVEVRHLCRVAPDLDAAGHDEPGVI